MSDYFAPLVRGTAFCAWWRSEDLCPTCMALIRADADLAHIDELVAGW